MMSAMSAESRPALASRSSASQLMSLAIAFTLSSAGGCIASRSTIDK